MPGYFSPQLRRRLAPLMLGVGVLLFGKIAHEELPQEQAVRYSLSPAQQSTARRVRVTYQADGDVLSGLEQTFREGEVPAAFDHKPSLKPGRYQVAVDLFADDGRVTRVQRMIEVPSEGTTRISLAGAASR
jgi:hypothetical protein